MLAGVAALGAARQWRLFVRGIWLGIPVGESQSDHTPASGCTSDYAACSVLSGRRERKPIKLPLPEKPGKRITTRLLISKSVFFILSIHTQVLVISIFLMGIPTRP